MSDRIYKDALFLIHVDTPQGVLDWLRRAFHCEVCGAIPGQDCIRQLGEVQVSSPHSAIAACHLKRGQ